MYLVDLALLADLALRTLIRKAPQPTLLYTASARVSPPPSPPSPSPLGESYSWGWRGASLKSVCVLYRGGMRIVLGLYLSGAVSHARDVKYNRHQGGWSKY